MDMSRLIADRCSAIDASGIRRVFELGARLTDPINLSIGQPDFPVPDPIKDAAVKAIQSNHNGYSMTQGITPLIRRIREHLTATLQWPDAPDDIGVFVTSGTSGGLLLAVLATLNPGDEIIIPDPYFVAYPHMATLAGARAVICDTYPDFRMTAERIEPLITERTKIVLLNTPSNPCGVVLPQAECEKVRDLCRERGLLLIADEIYDEFCYSDARDSGHCPSAARGESGWQGTLLIRGFGKTYGCTGWRMGYAAGPKALIEEMAKLQQYTFVCAPMPLQHGCMATFDVDMEPTVARYQQRRDKVVATLGEVTDVTTPGGAFYAFARVPEHLGLTGMQFCERALERNVMIIPGGVFSERDTHVRLSFATAEAKLEQGVEILRELMAS